MNLSVGVTEDKWVATCVLVDKLEKVPVSALKGDLVELDLTEEAVTKLLDSLKVRRSAVLTCPLVPSPAYRLSSSHLSYLM